MEQSGKKPMYKKWWFWVVGLFVFFALVGSLGGNNQNAGVGMPQSGQPDGGAQPAAPAAQKQYVEVFTFSGNGAKKSEPFNIQGDRFKIAYDCKGDPMAALCTAFVYKVGSSFPQALMNSPKSVQDETVIYTQLAGTGEYYIDTNIIGSFTMTVYDYR